jgi:hypothetical protein
MKGSTIEVRVVRTKDFMEGKAVEVALTDDIPVAAVCKDNDRVDEVNTS